jgi:hypothetical protein
MQTLVEGGLLVGDDWPGKVEAVWAAAVAAEVASDDGLPEPARWADYEEKRQRTVRLAARVRDLLLAHGPEGFFPEEPLAGRGDRLKGIADLVLRTDSLHAVIDYKTGSVASDDGQPVKAEYDRQLHLYAALEAETSNSMPDEVAIYPLKGPIVAIDVSPEACDQVAADALAELDAYNALAPGPQKARPGPEVCPRCEFAPTCGAFWDNTPMEGVATAAGDVAEVFIAERGSVSVSVDQPGGDRIEVLAIPPSIHPAAAFIKTGDHVRFIGLKEKEEPGFFRLPASGFMGVESAS